MSLRALPAMFDDRAGTMVQTVRGGSGDGVLTPEGLNLRYAAIVALGVQGHPEADQRAVLGGYTAAEFSGRTADLVVGGTIATDLGAAALAVWAMAETSTVSADHPLVTRLLADTERGVAAPTVDFAWTLTALLALEAHGSDPAVAAATTMAAQRLMSAQGAHGLFPHHLPTTELGRLRANVSCFADQVYPIQALARYAQAVGDQSALAAANRCARRIVELQGDAGQWWWHYDARTGDVIEALPVYSVHQHAMAPMVLLELHECGGDDHRDAVVRGLSWIFEHPESRESLLDPATGAIWRKVGRREPRKAARSIRAVSTSVRPGLTLRWLDRLFPAGPVDHECRPYELGWLLYAWTPARIADAMGRAPADQSRPTVSVDAP